MPYKYNPLLKLDLQKQQDVPEPPQITIDDELSDTSENAVQNKVITTELNKITDTQKKKVPKFSTSIEELEDGEIGEYQGGLSVDYVEGFFYKKQIQAGRPKYIKNGTIKFMSRTRSSEYGTTIPFWLYQTIFEGSVPSESFITQNPYLRLFFKVPELDTNVGVTVFDENFPVYSEYKVSQHPRLYFPSYGKYLNGYVVPFVDVAGSSAQILPLKVTADNLFILYNNNWIPLGSIAGAGDVPNIWYDAYCHPYLYYIPCKVVPADGLAMIFPTPGNGGLILLSSVIFVSGVLTDFFDLAKWTKFELSEDLYSYDYNISFSPQRVDTQPPTDLTTVNDAIATLQSKFASLIKTVTINATNDADEGLVPLGLNSANVVVLSVYCSGLMCVPCIGIGGSGMIGCAISEFAPWSIPPAVARDFIVTYIDKSVL